MLSRVIFLITNTILPKIGKRLLIGPQSTNGSGCSFQQTFVGKETSDEPLREAKMCVTIVNVEQNMHLSILVNLHLLP